MRTFDDGRFLDRWM